jgi:hypothetical protein
MMIRTNGVARSRRRTRRIAFALAASHSRRIRARAVVFALVSAYSRSCRRIRARVGVFRPRGVALVASHSWRRIRTHGVAFALAASHSRSRRRIRGVALALAASYQGGNTRKNTLLKGNHMPGEHAIHANNSETERTPHWGGNHMPGEYAIHANNSET